MANKKKKTKTKGIFFRVTEDLFLQARRAAYWDRQDITGVCETTLREWIKRCQEKYNQGAPFDPLPDENLDESS